MHESAPGCLHGQSTHVWAHTYESYRKRVSARELVIIEYIDGLTIGAYYIYIMSLTNERVTFREQTSSRETRYEVTGENGAYVLAELTDEDAPTSRLDVKEPAAGIYEFEIDERTPDAHNAMLANAAFQALVLEDPRRAREIPVVTTVGIDTDDFMKSYTRVRHHEDVLGLKAMDMTPSEDETEVIMVGSAESVSGSAEWELQKANILRTDE